jgi:peptide/nickel transport system substrate-binding protein
METLAREAVRAATVPVSARDTVVAGWHSEPETLDPSKGFDLGFEMQVAESMWHIEGASLRPTPALATEWRTSPDGKEWTFNIRQGVRFHDGNPLSAADVQWTFDRWMDSKHPFHDPPYGLTAYHFRNVEKVVATGKYTVKMMLKRVDPAFDATILTPNSYIVSPEAVRKLGKKGFGLKPAFTGPWKVTEWNRGTRRVLERFDDYWGKKPILRRLILKPIPEVSVRLAQLKRGEVDVIVDVPANFIPTIESDPNLRLLRATGNHVWWIPLNVREGPLSDKRVRQALNYAVNKEAVVRDLLKGGAVVAPGPLMVGSWAEDKSLRPYPYDPRKAKQLLAAAGHPNGFRTRFWVPESGSGMVAPKEIATVVQSQLRDVGVIAEIVTQEWTSYLDRYGAEGLAPKGKPAFGMGEMSWNAPLPDPILYVDVNLSGDAWAPKGFNCGFYRNSEVDRMLKEAGSTLDRERRRSLYVKAQRIIHEEAPWIFMFSAQNLIATRRNIRGVEVNPIPWWYDFTTMYVEG